MCGAVAQLQSAFDPRAESNHAAKLCAKYAIFLRTSKKKAKTSLANGTFL